MANIFVISDTHFGHANIIAHCARPFADVDEMDELMVSRWNDTVKPSDHVYHLGDVAMKRALLPIVKRLNGHKRLVFGNHDIFDAKDYLAAGFQKLCGMRVLDGVILTHVPIHPNSMGRFVGNVHGHVHNNQALAHPYVNVSVEVIDYTPVALERITIGLRNRAERPQAVNAVDPHDGVTPHVNARP